MRKITLTLFTLLCAFSMNAQVVINEILYNIPGSGEDQEFIELVNTSSSDVDVSNWTVTRAVVFTFPANYSIAAGDYFVLAKDSAAFHTSFGFAPDAVWTSGGLSNSGEDIVIADGTAVVQDSVDYDDNSPWPTEADGGGQSLQLCDPLSDNNNGNNWSFSTDSTGYNTATNANALYATPGAVNVCASITPTPVNLPVYSISQINSVNSNGVADSLNVQCEINGIVHCGDFNGGTTLDFTVIQSSTENVGIKVYSPSIIDGYVVTQGDSLRLVGTVGFFRGMTQFNPDTIEVLSQGNNTVAPLAITEVNEGTESKHLVFENGYLATPSQWTSSGSFNVNVTNGTDTILVRLDSDVALASEPAPTDTFDIFGLGGQYDTSSPYDSGYQFMACHLIADSTDTTSPTPTVIPSYTISEIDGINANGVADSLDVVCQIIGIVHCQDFRGNAGIEFTVMESSTQNVGIRVFSFSDIDSYSVTEGDSLRIVGKVAQHKGNLQFAPDSIEVLSQGNGTVTPMLVTDLSELTENKLVEIKGLTLVDSSEWTGSGSGFNVNVTNGTTTMKMRIDNDSPLYSQSAPNQTFDIIGLGGQYDSSDPYTDGYQVFPCSLTEQQDTTDNSSVIELNGIKFNVFPNPVTNIVNVEVESTDAFDVQIVNLAGKVVLTAKLEGTTKIDVSELSAGFYSINLIGSNGIATTRLIKQ